MTYFVINYDPRRLSHKPWYCGTYVGAHPTLASAAWMLRGVAARQKLYEVRPWFVNTAYQFNDKSWAIWADIDGPTPDAEPNPSIIVVPTFREAFHIALSYARWLPSKRIPA